MVYTRNQDAALREQIRILLILLPVESSGRPFHVVPAQPVPGRQNSGPADRLGNDGPGVAGPKRILFIRSGKPALRGIDGKEHVRVLFPLVRVRNHRKTPGAAEFHGIGRQCQPIVSVGQGVQGQLSARGPFPLPDNFIPPVPQSPANRLRFTLQREPQCFPLQEGGAGRAHADFTGTVEGRGRGGSRRIQGA